MYFMQLASAYLIEFERKRYRYCNYWYYFCMSTHWNSWVLIVNTVMHFSEYFRLLRWHIRHENPINKGNYNYLLFSLSEITKKLFVSFLCENDFFMFCFYLELLSPGSNSSHKSRFIHDSNSVNTFTNILQSTLFTNRITRWRLLT